MADALPSALSGLEHVAKRGRAGSRVRPAGVRLYVRNGVALASVIARKGAGPSLSACVHDAFGLVLPSQPRRTSYGSIATIWSGPGQWLAVSETGDGGAWEARLRAAVCGFASVCDQSDGRLIFRISGEYARETLAKGMPIDLHPEAFSTDHAALTLIGHTAVQIWQLDDRPTYDIAVFRSLSADLWRFLVHAGAEFGVDTLYE